MTKSDTTADNHRRLISQRLLALGMSARELSKKLDKGHSYISDFLNKGMPRRLDVETLLVLSTLLQVTPSAFGIDTPGRTVRAVGSGLSEDDATPYTPPPESIFKRSEQIEFFTMKSKALDQHPRRIMPGAVLAFDLKPVTTANVPDGAIVLVQLYDRGEFTKSHGTVIHQFIAPNKLATNSSAENAIISLDDERLPYEAAIRGVLLAVVG